MIGKLIKDERVKLFLLSVLVLFAGFCHAHKDQGIYWSNSGELTGLPPEYSPASFHRDTLQLSVGNTTINLPPCAAKFFIDNAAQVSISASWNHDPQILPAYLRIKIKASSNYAFILVLALKDLNPLHFNIQTFHDQKTLTHPISISDECRLSFKQ